MIFRVSRRPKSTWTREKKRSARASSPFRILLETDTYGKELLTRNRDIQESASSANNGTEQYYIASLATHSAQSPFSPTVLSTSAWKQRADPKRSLHSARGYVDVCAGQDSGKFSSRGARCVSIHLKRVKGRVRMRACRRRRRRTRSLLIFNFCFLLISHTISHTGMREYIYEVGTYPNRIRQEKNSMQA